MALAHEGSGDAGLDEWVAQLGGEEGFVAMIEETKRRVADSSLPGFHDEQSLSEFLGQVRRGNRQSA
jgi:hypothetical protein